MSHGLGTSWGGMSAAGVGPLCFLRTNVTAAVYQVLEHFLLPTAEQLFGSDEFTFQHDLAPAHDAKYTKTWFTTYEIQVLSWLANSPDLNLIKNLWRIAKKRMDYFGAAKGIHQASLELAPLHQLNCQDEFRQK